MSTPRKPAPAPADLDPASALPFSTLPLSPATLANLSQLGYERMTPVQAASLPLALGGSDLIVQAKTGSGKTAAFALPLLASLNPRSFAVQALVLCPTRELAEQVAQEVRRIARAEDNIKTLTLCGGAPVRPQIASLEHGAHVVVGTPGRILDHLARETLNLDALSTLVLDEADRMLDMGFAEDLASVIQRCPARRQTLLFSATYPEGVMKLAGKFMRQPQEVKLTERHADAKIRQRFYEVKESERLHAVGLLVNHFRPASTLAFCNTKQQCRDLVAVLQAQGIVALELHGDLEQRERDQVLVQFANRSCSVLVATDVAARGLDIAQLEAVINVDITPDVEVHTHRVGRTGRADDVGWAFSLASMEEMGRVGRIDEMQGSASVWHPLSELVPPAGAEPLHPPMVTLQILGGRKEKIRPGDVLGALTKDLGFEAAQIGKISVNEFSTYVAVERGIADKALRGLNAGKVKGKSVKVENALSTFESLGLSPALLKAATERGYATPTAIQVAAIPAALNGSDVLASARTGSGKTAAFALPLLQQLEGRARTAPRSMHALVLVPTRELADQVGETILGLARQLAEPIKVSVLFGGVSVNPQMMRLRGGAEVVVATPGRLLDLVDRNALRLGDVALLVLDEADRLLDAGFADELARVIALLPRRRQSLLFSATFPGPVRALAREMLHEPACIDASMEPEAAPDIAQHAVHVDAARRTPLLRHMIEQGRWTRVLVFVATKYATEHVADKLRRSGVDAAAFHGDLGQGARARVLSDFHGGRLQVLVATDIAGRGLDIRELPVVVNYDLPRAPSDYVHRIGRTARAGASGLAVSFVSAATEAHFRLIEKRQGQRVARETIAGFEPKEASVPPSDPAGGVKGRRKSKKDKLREAGLAGVPPRAAR